MVPIKAHLKIIGTGANGEDVIKLMNNRRADVVILDINMPKMNGIQCTEWIKKNYPQTKVIILTMFPEKSYIDQRRGRRVPVKKPGEQRPPGGH